MILVNYNKKNNYPHHKKIILFDRDAFQSLGNKGLLKVNKIYNILCPQVFVIECLAPNNASEREKRTLHRRLKLIKNPIVFTGDTHISSITTISRAKEDASILTAEEIARNCIRSALITMERVTPKRLISHYESKVTDFFAKVKDITERINRGQGTLTSNQVISDIQNSAKEHFNILLPKEQIKQRMKKNERFNITSDLSYASKAAFISNDYMSVAQSINHFASLLDLSYGGIQILKSEIKNGKHFTVENYPHFAYPIYVYYLYRYMVHARQLKTKHLDKSYVRDFRYFHYLNFCDRFITNEKSTPYIVNSFLYDDIKNTPISTVAKLKSEVAVY